MSDNIMDWSFSLEGQERIAELSVEALIDVLDENEEVKKYWDRKKIGDPVDYSTTTWGLMLADPEIRDELSRRGKLFRRRFRVPHSLFEEICRLSSEANVFEIKRQASVVIPLEHKVLCCLRILGRGNCLDDIAEFSCIPEQTIFKFFPLFIHNFVARYKDTYIYVPEGDEMQKCLQVMDSLGLTGNVGSMDNTHWRWNKCPFAETVDFTNGQYGKPTVSFALTVTHDRMVRSCSIGFPGTWPDKTTCKYDDFAVRLRSGTILNDITFELEFPDGTKKLVVGSAYLIVDGGFTNETFFICPYAIRSDSQEVYWSEWLESVRKDVECCIGIIKIRMQILLKPCEFHSLALMTDIFAMCCILHNMLLCFDGLDINSWMDERVWADLNPNGGANEGTEEEEGGEDVEDVEYENLMNEALQPFIVNNVDQNEVIPAVPPIFTLNEERVLANEFRNVTTIEMRNGLEVVRFLNRNSLRSALVYHFSMRYYKGLLRWPKRMQPIVKAMLPIPGRGMNNQMRNKALEIMERAREDVRKLGRTIPTLDSVLYAAPSTLFRENGESIGQGLFSTKPYVKDEVVAEFHGELISQQEYKRREKAGRGGYAVHFSLEGPEAVLDCYQNRMDSICMASLANSNANNVRYMHIEDGEVNLSQTPVHSNVKLVPDTNTRKAKLVCRVPRIPHDQEIIWYYKKGYRFGRK